MHQSPPRLNIINDQEITKIKKSWSFQFLRPFNAFILSLCTLAVIIFPWFDYQWQGHQTRNNVKRSTNNSSCRKTENHLERQKHLCMKSNIREYCLPWRLFTLSVHLQILNINSRITMNNPKIKNEMLHYYTILFSYIDHITNGAVCETLSRRKPTTIRILHNHHQYVLTIFPIRH